MSAPGPPWTPEEDGLLRSMGAAGESAAAISTLLKRTPPTQCASGLTYSTSRWPVRCQGRRRREKISVPTTNRQIQRPILPAQSPFRLTASGRSLFAELLEPISCLVVYGNVPAARHISPDKTVSASPNAGAVFLLAFPPACRAGAQGEGEPPNIKLST